MSSITKGDLSRAFNAFEGLEVVLFSHALSFFGCLFFRRISRVLRRFFSFLTATHSYKVFGWHRSHCHSWTLQPRLFINPMVGVPWNFFRVKPCLLESTWNQARRPSWNHRSPVRYLSWANGSSSRRAIQPGQPWSWLSTGRALGWTADDFEVRSARLSNVFSSHFLIVCRVISLDVLVRRIRCFFSLWVDLETWHDSIP